MKKVAWKKKIIEQMMIVDTYDDAFLSAIETCADILARRDQAMAQWRKEGCVLMCEFVSDRGATNQKKNPLLALVQECERDALTYWSQLGLTPSGLKKTFASEKKVEEPKSALVEALKSLHA